MGSYPTASFLLLSKTMDSYLWTTTSGKEVEELYQQFEHYLFKDLVKHSTLKPDTLKRSNG